MKENIFDVTNNLSHAYSWKRQWYMYVVTFLPGMVAIKLNIVLELLQQKEDARNFAEVYNSENGGILVRWRKNVPHLIQRIKSYLIGYANHRKFISVLRKQKSDLKDYIHCTWQKVLFLKIT